jgi:hypothetical protein
MNNQRQVLHCLDRALFLTLSMAAANILALLEI